jgi:sterol 14-demethylase
MGRFRLADRDVVLVSGAEVNEQFFRAPDSTLDQAAAYPFMTPIFGKGVVFDASPEERQQMLKNQALRGDMMRGHAATIEAEINRMVADWGDEGEIDLLDVLISLDMTADYITGVFISMMFAGHHTSSGTASWALIELLRNPAVMAEVVAELDELYADGSEVSFQALRSIPQLEAALKETLRLHPPLVLLLRVAQEDFELGGHLIPPGTMVGATPRVSNRIAEDFPDPDRFDPGRYLDPRQEDLANRWTWIPFGAGRHRCVGNAFAMMQMKAIFSVILRDFEFEMAQPPETYRDDTSKMVIQLARPATVRYRRRSR